MCRKMNKRKTVTYKKLAHNRRTVRKKVLISLLEEQIYISKNMTEAYRGYTGVVGQHKATDTMC